MAINKATSGAIYARSTSATMTNEATTSAAGNIYQITAAAKQCIDPDVAYSLNTTSRSYLDKTWMDEGWDLFTGRVKLSTATSPTITGSYLTLTALADVVSWSMNNSINTQETTGIGDTWKEYTVVSKGSTLSINRYYPDTNFWTNISSSRSVILKIYEDGTSGFWCQGIVTGFNPSFTVGQVDNEAITFQVTSVVTRFG